MANIIGDLPSQVKTAAQGQGGAKAVVAAFAAAQSNSGGGSSDPPVYLGTRAGIKTTTVRPGVDKPTQFQERVTAPLSQVAGQYYNWDVNTKNKFLTQLNLAGYDTSQMSDDKIASAWANYAQQAASYLKNGVDMTPWDILAKDRQQRERYQSTPRTVSQTQTSTNLSSAEDAHAIFMQAAQSLLGRDPTKSETTKFRSALNAYERANPSISTTTSKYMGDQLTSQSTQTSGGVSDTARQDIAMQDVKKDPEYGAYQAATTYFDALMQMVGGR